MNGKVILFTNARDEKNLKEWVAHHLLLGFDFIYIFDHKSIIPLKGQFLDFNKDKFQVYVERCELDGGIKTKLISTAAEIAKRQNFEWMLYLDADEFLVINNDKITNVKKLLSYYPYADSLSCNWLLFGTNYHVEEPEGLIIDNYTRSEPSLDHHLKSFIRPNQFLSPNAHRSDIKTPDKAYHFNRTQLNKVVPIYRENKHFINPILFEDAKIFIAHYVVQSEETYIRRKVNRPDDHDGTFRKQDIVVLRPIPGNNIHDLFNDKVNTLVKNKYSNNIKLFLKNINEENVYCF
jgi:hypothetical protein